MDFSKRLDEALGISESPDMLPQHKEKIDIITRRILKGKGLIKKALKRGYVTMSDIIIAIRNKRCLSMPNRDIGFTHLSTAIGSAISDVFKGQDINDARAIYGLKPVDFDKEHQKKLNRSGPRSTARSPK